MSQIKPAEVSAILREQLAGNQTDADLQEVGTVLQVGDGIARIYGLSNVQAGELIEFENGVRGIALNLEEDNVGAVLLEPSGELKEGSSVKRLNRIASVKVGRGMLGRVVNTLGEPIDGKGHIEGRVLLRKSGKTVGSFKYSSRLRGGITQGSLKSMAKEVGPPLVLKLDGTERDSELHERPQNKKKGG